jgi:hypothetical protein
MRPSVLQAFLALATPAAAEPLPHVTHKIAIVRQLLAAANDMCVAPRVQPIF